MIRLRKITAADQDWLATAMEAYMAEIVPGQRPLKLEQWWSDAERDAFAIETPDTVGFAMVRKTEAEIWDMSEFTIFQSMRRAGLGAAATAEILRTRPGPWQLGVVRQPAAMAFWPRALRTVEGLRNLTQHPPMTEFQALSYRFDMEGERDG